MARYNVGRAGHIQHDPYKRTGPWEEIELSDDELPAWEWIPLDEAAELAMSVAIEVHEYKAKLRQHSGKQIGDAAGEVVIRGWRNEQIEVGKDKDGKPIFKPQRMQVEEAVPWPDDDFIAQEFWPNAAKYHAKKRTKQLLSQRRRSLEKEAGEQATAPTMEKQVAAIVAQQLAKMNAAKEVTTMSAVENQSAKLRKRAADGEPG